ncbi:hydroxyproline dehydrogenase [Catharus ustulatus]|uniref:hydroxyproline dehydrogenase n=1 Tax=Catharus ustulatus TaxID=91951 RepID=UPI001C5AD2B6|nr:hydroxyproline dehydrogenase [Catharus ustulatus]
MGPGQGGCEGEEESPLQVQLREGRALAALGWWELLRGLLVFALCSHPWLQQDPEAFLRASRRLLGARLWRALLSVSLWGHFAVGRSPAAIEELSRWLRARGLRPMLALPIEGEGPDGEGEAWFEQNLGAALECVGLAAASGPEPAMQLKVTALLSQRLCEKLSLRLAEPEGAGLNPEEVAAMLGGQVPELTWLSPAENQHLGRGLRRLEEVAQAAVARRVQVLVDAEMSHLNPALTCLTWGLMWRHNRGGPRAWIWNTWQAYLRDTESHLAAHLAQARRSGLPCGVKLVRGAYLEQERGRARGYGRCLELLGAALARPGPGLWLMVATHNEGSVLQALRLSPRPSPNVSFAQLQGMGESLGMELGRSPYLARRAAENRGALGGARRERELLWAELGRRLRPWRKKDNRGGVA